MYPLEENSTLTNYHWRPSTYTYTVCSVSTTKQSFFAAYNYKHLHAYHKIKLKRIQVLLQNFKKSIKVPNLFYNANLDVNYLHVQ